MKLYSKSILLALSTLLLFSTSCGDDDAGPSFEDQNLQGVIDGNVYEFGEGTVDNSSFGDEELLSLDLLHEDEEYETICTLFGFGELVSVFFSAPAEVGLYNLGLNSGRSITLYSPNSEFQNIIVTDGAVEILSISASQVTGRIDARFDGDSYVNGNFTAVFCVE